MPLSFFGSKEKPFDIQRHNSMNELKRSVGEVDGKHPSCIPTGGQYTRFNQKMDRNYHTRRRGGSRYTTGVDVSVCPCHSEASFN